MSSERLRLYRLDSEYVRELSLRDRNVLSTLPEQGKDNRPFVGVVIVRGDKAYCVPLSSPKPKHVRKRADRDFSKIVDGSGKLIGVLNLNNMIPVNDAVLMDLDLHRRLTDGYQVSFFELEMSCDEGFALIKPGCTKRDCHLTN